MRAPKRPLSRTGSAIAMHHRFWEPVRARLRPQALVLVNAGVFDAALDRAQHRVFEVPAREIAAEIGSPLAASLVLIGFYAGATGMVSADALVEAMRASLPGYRQQHAAQNEKALRAGFAAAPPGAAPAWSGAAH